MGDFARTTFLTLTLALGLTLAGAPSSAAAQEAPDQQMSGQQVSGTAEVAAWVIGSGDNQALPFVIVDKVAAQVAVFGADGQLLGVEPALLGSARGDDSAPGIGEKKLSAITPDERTTPAGRFVAAYGPAYGGRKVLWVDYGAAISLHPVVTANRKEKRLDRLASVSPDDNRITYGCINVSAGFYEDIVRKTFTGTKGVVYILPETRSADEVFPALKLARATATPPPEQQLAVAEEPGLDKLAQDAAVVH